MLLCLICEVSVTLLYISVYQRTLTINEIIPQRIFATQNRFQYIQKRSTQNCAIFAHFLRFLQKWCKFGVLLRISAKITKWRTSRFYGKPPLPNGVHYWSHPYKAKPLKIQHFQGSYSSLKTANFLRSKAAVFQYTIFSKSGYKGLIVGNRCT